MIRQFKELGFPVLGMTANECTKHPGILQNQSLKNSRDPKIHSMSQLTSILISARKNFEDSKMRCVNVILIGIVVVTVSLCTSECSAQQGTDSPLPYDSQTKEFFTTDSIAATEVKTDILNKQIDLTAPGKKNVTRAAADKNRESRPNRPSMLQTVLGLAFVLCLIWIVAAWAKKFFPSATGGLPPEAIQVLGQRTIGQRQMLQLIRCGSRILVVGSTAQGLTTLSEITDPVEVDYLTGLCQQQQTNSVSSAFSQLFQNYRETLAESDSPTNPLRTMTERFGWKRAENSESRDSEQVPTSPAENTLKERLGRIQTETPVSTNAEDVHG